MDISLNHTLMEALGMEIETADKDRVQIKMPVDERTHQPMGYLHGGASAALAESAASIGAYLNVNPATHQVFGMEINANHMKSVRSGFVKGTAEPLHIGRNSMVWSIEIKSDEGQLLSIARCTIGVVPINSERKTGKESI
ncbi:hotdog fold thioesterase [Halobacillus salinarum]|uniref:Hotdog fold thioesterase n=1 Tax=Halobacillus salinarum TaxID=2932257 RepID=A0ABY4EPJ2_9BACI|nr:hotdog fold thioesterase [Halobacillus salinarum]UOQ46078.1 hotdog fold thioesterase [Halobacillus salinarum]